MKNIVFYIEDNFGKNNIMKEIIQKTFKKRDCKKKEEEIKKKKKRKFSERINKTIQTSRLKDFFSFSILKRSLNYGLP